MPSIQVAGSHILEVHVCITNYSNNFVVVQIIIQILGGQSDGTSESSIQESSQLLVHLYNIQYIMNHGLMKSRSQISAKLDAAQKLIGTPLQQM